jgi:hypothetical protein
MVQRSVLPDDFTLTREDNDILGARLVIWCSAKDRPVIQNCHIGRNFSTNPHFKY